MNAFCGCCIPKIEARDCGEVLMITAERDMRKSKSSKEFTQMY